MSRSSQSPHELVDGGQQYLESAIQTASPARLRLMLIERAVAVCDCLAESWKSESDLGCNEHSLKLLEIFGELLAGVVCGKTKQEQDVCSKVADLYVFLTQHLVAAESNSDVASVEEIKTVLEVEAETWRAVCLQDLQRDPASAPSMTPSPSGGLNLEA